MARPLKTIQPLLPAGSFAAVRKHDVHTGVDLYCEEGAEVLAIEAGVVERVGPFTGALAGSPWWNDTSYVGVVGESGFVVYGEVELTVKVGDRVEEGAVIGRVLRVLKKDKGLPTTMLHLELYRTPVEPVIWALGEPQPEGLCDPTWLVFCSSQEERS